MSVSTSNELGAPGASAAPVVPPAASALVPPAPAPLEHSAVAVPMVHHFEPFHIDETPPPVPAPPRRTKPVYTQYEPSPLPPPPQMAVTVSGGVPVPPHAPPHAHVHTHSQAPNPTVSAAADVFGATRTFTFSEAPAIHRVGAGQQPFFANDYMTGDVQRFDTEPVAVAVPPAPAHIEYNMPPAAAPSPPHAPPPPAAAPAADKGVQCVVIEPVGGVPKVGVGVGVGVGSASPPRATPYGGETVDKCVECEVCGSLFGDAGSLKRHFARAHRANTGKGPVYCSQCSASLKNEQNLRRHIAVCHSGSQENRCDMCSASFSSRGSLRIHQQTVHAVPGAPKAPGTPGGAARVARTNGAPARGRVKKPKQEKSYLCDMCSDTFKWKGNLKRHRELRHLGLRPYECHICHASFGTKSNMRVHLITHQNNAAAAARAPQPAAAQLPK